MTDTTPRRRWRKRNDCPHVHVHGIYSDAINHNGRYYRLFCDDCNTFLRGPVSIVAYRRIEAEGLAIDAMQRFNRGESDRG